MKDSEIRAIVLQKFYDKRREGNFVPSDYDFPVNPDLNEALHICDQLRQHGLIHWVPVYSEGIPVKGSGRISAAGVDVIESGGKTAPVAFTFPPVTQHITFNHPSNVQIGNHNVQNIQQVFSELIEKINLSGATEEKKAEAKGLLRSFLEHPLVGSIAGELVGSLPGLLQ